ncbi:MAG: hypothetical protein AAFZ02_13850, partial [Pseudomonadota bacterium]
MAVAQADLLCSACGGQCAYSPRARALVCESCGTEHTIPHDGATDAARESAYDGSAPDAPIRETEQVHSCETCGGSVVIRGAALSERCSYCDGPLVRQLEDVGFEAMALIPFQEEEDVAWRNALSWAAARVAAPKDLVDRVSEGRMATLYAPFFTFDSTDLVDYWGTYTVKRGKSRVRR